MQPPLYAFFSRGVRAAVEARRGLPDGGHPGGGQVRPDEPGVGPQRERAHHRSGRAGGRGELHLPDLDQQALRAAALRQDQEWVGGAAAAVAAVVAVAAAVAITQDFSLDLASLANPLTQQGFPQKKNEKERERKKNHLFFPPHVDTICGILGGGGTKKNRWKSHIAPNGSRNPIKQ